MKKAFIITSSIDVSNDYPLTYSQTRSYFSAEERLRQTIYTLASLDSIRDDNVDIFLIDASETWEQYESILRHQKNLRFISIKKELSEIYNTVRTHQNKSHCETLIVSTIMAKYYNDLKNYDFLIKLSGRYFVDGSFTTNLFNEYNKEKLFFKKPLTFEWSDSWGYQMVDRRDIQGDNKLYQYSSVIYGWGSNYYDKILDINRVICDITGQDSGKFYDIETLLYYFTRDFDHDIITVPWTINGWYGADGRYLKY